jgi:signal transduction histidine kinase
MAQLIDDMLYLSRITRSDMKQDTVDLSTLVQVIAENLKQAAPSLELWGYYETITHHLLEPVESKEISSTVPPSPKS